MKFKYRFNGTPVVCKKVERSAICQIETLLVIAKWFSQAFDL